MTVSPVASLWGHRRRLCCRDLGAAAGVERGAARGISRDPGRVAGHEVHEGLLHLAVRQRRPRVDGELPLGAVGPVAVLLEIEGREAADVADVVALFGVLADEPQDLDLG
jgi:hypothetical protein